MKGGCNHLIIIRKKVAKVVISSNKMDQINDDEIYEYACCAIKYYLNKRIKRIKKDDESLYLSHILELIEKNRQKICESLHPAKVEEKNSIFSESYKLMKKGKDYIQGVSLFADGLLAKPFLLEKVNKSSRLGKHSYQIIDFVPSIQFNEEYKIKLAYQSYLLYFSLGFMPNNCKMINIQKEVLEFNPVSIFEEVKQIIDSIRRIKYTKEKPLSCINLHCKICRWKDKCLVDCIKRKDLSILFGVTKNKREILFNNNLKNIHDIARIDDKSSPNLKKQGIRNINFLVKQANAFINDKPDLFSIPKIPKRIPILYFDIEGQLDLNFQYLFGIYNEEEFKYVPFWADEIGEEKKAFCKLIRYLSKFKKYSLVHYGTYEKTAIKELCFKYNISKKKEDKIIRSMIDLYSLIKKSVALPIYSYSLKDVANFIGFRWRDKDALGVNSIIWHNNWLDTKDNKFKKRILQYNEDDCKATMFLKKYLEKLEGNYNGKKLV